MSKWQTTDNADSLSFCILFPEIKNKLNATLTRQLTRVRFAIPDGRLSVPVLTTEAYPSGVARNPGKRNPDRISSTPSHALSSAVNDQPPMIDRGFATWAWPSAATRGAVNIYQLRHRYARTAALEGESRAGKPERLAISSVERVTAFLQ